jgi:hypothetical protein
MFSRLESYTERQLKTAAAIKDQRRRQHQLRQFMGTADTTQLIQGVLNLAKTPQMVDNLTKWSASPPVPEVDTGDPRAAMLRLAASYLTSVAKELELIGTMEADDMLAKETTQAMEFKGRSAKPADKQRLAQRIIDGYHAMGNSTRVHGHALLPPSTTAAAALPVRAHFHGEPRIEEVQQTTYVKHGSGDGIPDTLSPYQRVIVKMRDVWAIGCRNQGHQGLLPPAPWEAGSPVTMSHFWKVFHKVEPEAATACHRVFDQHFKSLEYHG